MDNKKSEIDKFKWICHYDLNEVNITSEAISFDNGNQREFDFVIKNNQNNVIAIGDMVYKNDIENHIEDLEEKIKKRLLNYDVYIYSLCHDKLMKITPYREWLRYDFERMGMTLKNFISRLKYSQEEFKLEDDLEFDRVKEELNHLKKINSENEKKYVKLKFDSDADKKYYYEKCLKLENHIALVEKNDIDRLKYEFTIINNKVDLFAPLKKLGLNENVEYSFNLQKDEIILKVDFIGHFEGSNYEVARDFYYKSNYYYLNSIKKEYIEVKDRRYSDIQNWLRFDTDYELLN
jgi:hypothetical protein